MDLQVLDSFSEADLEFVHQILTEVTFSPPLVLLRNTPIYMRLACILVDKGILTKKRWRRGLFVFDFSRNANSAAIAVYLRLIAGTSSCGRPLNSGL